MQGGIVLGGVLVVGVVTMEHGRLVVVDTPGLQGVVLVVGGVGEEGVEGGGGASVGFVDGGVSIGGGGGGG